MYGGVAGEAGRPVPLCRFALPEVWAQALVVGVTSPLRSKPHNECNRLLSSSYRVIRCRKNSDLFVDTLRHMVTAPVLTFEKLTA